MESLDLWVCPVKMNFQSFKKPWIAQAKFSPMIVLSRQLSSVHPAGKTMRQCLLKQDAN